MRIMVMDGQGGGVGRSLLEAFKERFPEADLILLSLDGDRARHNAIRGDTYDTIMEHVEHATSDNICFYMAINQINKHARNPVACTNVLVVHVLLCLVTSVLNTP